MEANISLLILSFLLVSFTANGVSINDGISSVDQPSAVLDSSGNKLQIGEYYYLWPLMALPRLYSPSIIVGVYGNGTCRPHLDIAEFYYGMRALPLHFSPIHSNAGEFIYENVDLNIEFTDELSPLCGGSSAWKVDKFELVSLGGNKEDRNSWFKIEKATEMNDSIYKLVSSYGPDVGIRENPYGTKRLSLAHEPLRFVFYHVDSSSTALKQNF